MNNKWAPFNSVINSNEVLNDLVLEKKKIKMPNFSEEQLLLLEKKLVEAYYENEIISIDYYYSGEVLNVTDKIKKIDSIYHKIYFKNQSILFEQIIKLNY